MCWWNYKKIELINVYMERNFDNIMVLNDHVVEDNGLIGGGKHLRKDKEVDEELDVENESE